MLRYLNRHSFYNRLTHSYVIGKLNTSETPNLTYPFTRVITTIKKSRAKDMSEQLEQKIITEITPKRLLYKTPSPVRVCAYVRVSTNHDDQLSSFQSQAAYYQDKLSQASRCILVGIFSDAGISGAKDNRLGFQTMLSKARNGEIDLIYTKSISRFARNTLLLLNVVRELREIGVGIIFEEQNINTLRAEGELMLTVLAGIAEEERKSVRSNVQWAMKNKCLRGEVMVDTNRLIGYSKNQSGKLVINPAQAKIVREIYQLYLNGLSAYKIANTLNRQHIPHYSRSPWSSKRILSIISNEKYMGACLMQKSFVNDVGRQIPNNGQLDQYWVDDDHPAIISREDWDLAQKIRQRRAKKVYPFSSLLHCAYCGSTLIRVSHQGRWFSWICGRYLNQGKAACPGTRITEPKLIALTQDHPIIEPAIIEEIPHGEKPAKRNQKSYRFKPFPPDNKKQQEC